MGTGYNMLIGVAVSVSVIVWLILTRMIGPDVTEKPAVKTDAVLHGRAIAMGDKLTAKGERRKR